MTNYKKAQAAIKDMIAGQSCTIATASPALLRKYVHELAPGEFTTRKTLTGLLIIKIK